MEATYLGDIELTDETLAHYGVKGMKWRHRKGTVNSAMANDPRYQTGYIVKPGDERARLNRLNPAKPVTTATKKSSSSSTTSSSSSKSSKKGKSGSKKAVKDLLSRFKLTKSSGKGSSATKEKAAKGSSKKESTGSAKKESSGKTSSEKKSSSSESEKKTTTQQPQVIEKTRVSEDYTKYLERRLGKSNYSKLQNETVQERIKATDAQKKRRARGVRKIYTRS